MRAGHDPAGCSAARLCRRRRRSNGAIGGAWPRSGPAPSEYSRGQDKKRQLYRELIAATEASRDELQVIAAGLAEATEIGTERWRAEVAHSCH